MYGKCNGWMERKKRVVPGEVLSLIHISFLFCLGGVHQIPVLHPAAEPLVERIGILHSLRRQFLNVFQHQIEMCIRDSIYSIHLFVSAVFGDMSKLIRQKYS